jgi:disulfide oxidoreductase YuzD
MRLCSLTVSRDASQLHCAAMKQKSSHNDFKLHYADMQRNSVP